MENSGRIQRYDEFWLHYLREHSLGSCRALHYLGTTLAMVSLVWILASQNWAWLWIPLVAGYGPAWVGHFFFEHNRPATFQYPWWSFISDFKMFFFALTGQLKGELARALEGS